eukprot:6210747-Pleurochrysis_carterae.AAC.3
MPPSFTNPASIPSSLCKQHSDYALAAALNRTFIAASMRRTRGLQRHDGQNQNILRDVAPAAAV